MNNLQLNIAQFEEMRKNPSDGPIVMLNLLKFKKDGGGKSYAAYVREAGKFLEGVGGKVIYLGKTAELLNGSESWDILMLVKYPSRKAFLKMVDDPEYLKVHKFRDDALDRAVLYATDELGFDEFYNMLTRDI